MKKINDATPLDVQRRFAVQSFSPFSQDEVREMALHMARSLEVEWEPDALDRLVGGLMEKDASARTTRAIATAVAGAKAYRDIRVQVDAPTDARILARDLP
jgi:DNA helicase TIP49 (TBP-interacting protein)